MSHQRKTVTDVQEALKSLKGMLAPELAERVVLSKPYKFVGENANWPKPYDEFWERPVGTGVYLIFDEDDHLIYVGKADTVGTRLGSYFHHDKPPAAGKCRVVEPTMDGQGGRPCATYVRVIALDNTEPAPGPSPHYLGPSLERYLIAKLNPCINKQGRTVCES